MKWINKLPRCIQDMTIIMVVVVSISLMMSFAREGMLQGWHIIWQWVIVWLAIEFHHNTIDR